MERCIHKYVYNYCVSYKVITPFHSGFVHGVSKTYQLTDMTLYNSFCEAIDSGKEVCIVFCDISKAFDRVWHDGLLFELKSIGISGKLLFGFEIIYLTENNALLLIGIPRSLN